MRFYFRPGHPRASPNGFVSEVDLAEVPMDETRAIDAPIMVDRFYENVSATDGTDIGSRRKHREYMKRNNLTVASDFSKEWARAAVEREKVRDGSGDFDHKSRREALERAVHQRYKP